MPRLTDFFVEDHARPPMRGQTFYADSELPGLWLRVTPKRKFFVVQWTANGMPRSITIGEARNLTVEQARDEASRVLSALAEPSALGTHGDGVVTLGKAFEKYMSVRILRRNTIRLYTELMRRCLNDWQEIPITQISKAMVETRHRELRRITRYGTDNQGEANGAMKLLRAVLNFAADYYEMPDGSRLLTMNPVRRLSQNKSWYRLPPRQNIIPDHKLSAWYKAVMSLKNRTAADYLLFVLLTGFRRNEAASLRWCDIHFGARLIVVPAEISKNHQSHRFPMSPFIERLLTRRFQERKKSEYVFPGRAEKGHITEFRDALAEVRARSDCKFVIHDMRRGFLTMAERLDVPHYALKRLANHSSASDVTAAYLIMDVERLRPHIARITDQFLALLFPDWLG